MKRFRFFSFLPLIFVLFCASPEAASPLEQIQAAISKPDILCGYFRQQKTLQGIQSPLISEGRFCVLAEKGILWRNLKPFEHTLLLTKNKIVVMQGNTVTAQLDVEKEPMMQVVNQVYFALVSGNFSQLENLFNMEARIRNSVWHVSLRAKNASLAKAIDHISLDGSNYVKSIMIREGSGNKTRITFSDIRTGKDALQADEVKLYE